MTAPLTPPASLEWFTEQDVVSTLTLRQVAEHLATMQIALHEGRVESLPKIMSSNPAKSLHVLASAETEGRYGGVKCWVNAAKGGAVALFLLFDIEQGRLLATIEAGALGALRTAAASLLAARALKPQGASRLTIIGTGRQAYTQLAAALIAVEPQHVSVWSPTAANREAFAQKAGTIFNTQIHATATLEEATRDADVIVTVTRSADPILNLQQLPDRDLHISAMGAIFANRAELDPAIVAKASAVVVDDINRATTADRELEPWLKQPGHQARSLGDVLSHPDAARPAGLTIFKSWGIGPSDLAVAKALFEARQGQAATKIAYPLGAGPALMNSLAKEFSHK